MQNDDICEAFLLIFFPLVASKFWQMLLLHSSHSRGAKDSRGSFCRLLQNRLSHLADGEYDTWPKDPKAIKGGTGAKWIKMVACYVEVVSECSCPRRCRFPGEIVWKNAQVNDNEYLFIIDISINQLEYVHTTDCTGKT